MTSDQSAYSGPDRQRLRVALINSIVEKNDAISANVVDMAHIISEAGYDVTLFCYKNDYSDIPFVVVNGPTDLITHEGYRSADLIIWHYGIYYELFNAILIGNGRAPQIVCFHNVTPKEFVPVSHWRNIDRSLQQTHLLPNADEIWPVSRINGDVARDLGVAERNIHTIPLIVDEPQLSNLRDKSDEIVDILYVGRFVKAKGVDELLQAVAAMKAITTTRFHVTLVGNLSFSDSKFYQNLRDFVENQGMEEAVTFAGTVSEEDLFACYRKAHILAIPSYHEGFCKPVIEGLRSGCIPIGYGSYNIPFVANGLGRLVAPGDVEGLGAALGAFVDRLPIALRTPEEPLLALDGGTISVVDFERKASEFVSEFTKDNVSAQIRERMYDLLR